jgi:transcriptional regulator with XRE-family HTH domain
MRASGQSQAEMAQQTGVTQQRVSEFLQKKSLRSHLEKFAQIYAPEIYTNFNASEQ